MRMIFLAMDDYAKKNNGLLPPTLGALLTTEDITSEIFVCPSSNQERAPGDTADAQAAALGQDPQRYCSYIYVAGGLKLDEAAQPPRVLLYEALSNHKVGMNVLYSDGTAEFLPESKAQQLIASLSSPTTRH